LPITDRARKRAYQREWERSHPERSADRHGDRESGQRRDPTSPASHVKTREFIAVDGEGAYAPGDTAQRYVLLSDSTGRSIWSDLGLTTKECLDFFLGLSKKGIVVGFGLGYDTTHWLRDLHPADFKEKRANGRTYGLFGRYHDVLWPDPQNGPYHIRWIPKRFFEVSKPCEKDHEHLPRCPPDCRIVHRHEKTCPPDCPRKHRLHKIGCPPDCTKIHEHKTGCPPVFVHIDDVLSNFDGGFEKVVRDWLGSEEASPKLAWGKAQRSRFLLKDKRRIMAYNAEENALLVKVMQRYAQAREESGFRSSRFYSPAVLGRELLYRHHGKDYVKAPRPPVVEMRQRYAMFGAHIELGRIGRTRAGELVYEYDRRSAYPYWIAKVPNFANGRWERDRKTPGHTPMFRPNSPWSLYHVMWDFDPEKSLYFPLPFHTDTGAIRFPFAASGWCWASEVEVAIEAAPKLYGTVEILDAEHFIPNDPDEHPFAWIADVFAERARRKALPEGTPGHAAEYPLKIAMNAVNGLLSQTICFDPDEGPPFKDLALSGLVMAGTRADLYRIAMRNMPSVISFNTDAIFSTDPDLLRPEEIGEGFGQFKREVYEEGVFAKQGVYRLRRGTLPNGEPDYVIRARGVGGRALPFDRIIEGWHRHEERITYLLPKPHFVGAKQALAQNRFASRFEWEVQERSFDLRHPSDKRMSLPADSDPSLGLVNTVADYVGFMAEVESWPYKPKTEHDPEETLNEELAWEEECGEREACGDDPREPRTAASALAGTPPRLERARRSAPPPPPAVRHRASA
jgi:hypothetical protein